jgi:PAS domain S-box-containing protein
MLEALFENSFQFMGVLDAAGNVLACNRTSLDLIGRRADEILGRPFWEAPWWSHDPDEQARLRAAIRSAVEGNFVRLEATHHAADGTLRVVDFSLTPYRDEEGAVRWLFPEGRDVTAQKQAESALRESEEKFRQIFQRSQDGILLLDGDQFIESNPAVLEMMRCSQPELLRMHPWDLSPPVQPDGRPSGEKALEMIRLAHAKGGHRFEWTHRRLDGEDFPVEVTLTPFPLMGREVLYTTWRDITDRKREEREHLELERRVLHAQKLESLGILAGGIAHDFNNLMTAMMGQIELAGMTLPVSHEAREHLKLLDDILHRATDLTRQMLAYSGKGRFVVGPTDLSRMAREMSTLLASSVPKKIEVVLDLPDDLPSVEGDVAQLQQVVLNLVTNASDAIGDKPGRIRISTGVETLDLDAVSALHADARPAPGTYVYLEVSDTGSGIPQDVQHRIFEPFFTTKDTGRGLGLAALLGILRSHGGAFRMDSVHGRGTTFRLYFPSTGAQVAVMPEPAVTPSAFPPGLRVLLVEDEENVRDAAARLLVRIGFAVVTAVDGLDALEKLDAGPAYDVVLLDLTMPRMDGRQAMAAIRQRHPGVPVVLCSGYSGEEIQGGWKGVFLPKPYSLASLRKALREALKGT